MHQDLPTTVLICHEQDRLDREALAPWLASTVRLAGLILIRDKPGRLRRAARREIRRVGLLRFADVVAFRIYQRLFLAQADTAWTDQTVRAMQERYPADLAAIPTIVVTSPNSSEARAFLAGLKPDVAIARCKMILKPDIFEIPRVGTFVMHPGVCPEYRNAHGCFWALVNRDVERVGMTLLKVDAGIDTGNVYLQAGYDFDELAESHYVIQHRVVLENLDAIGRILIALSRGEQVPTIATHGRQSAEWGQPQLTAYLKWKHGARKSNVKSQRSKVDAPRIAAVS